MCRSMNDIIRCDHGSPAVRGVPEATWKEVVGRYSSLGVLDTMWELALKDSKASLKAFETFLAYHSLGRIENPVHLTEYYAQLWLTGCFIPFMKWATAVPMAALSGLLGSDTVAYRELPPLPRFMEPESKWWSVIFPGEARLWRTLRSRFHEKNGVGGATRRSLRLSWSLLGIKGMMPSMWVEKVVPALQDHAKNLSACPPQLDPRAVEALEVAAETVVRAYRTSGLLPDPGLVGSYQLIRYSDLPRARLSSKSGYIKHYDNEAQRFRSGSGMREAVFRHLGGYAAEELIGMSYNPKTGLHEHRGIPYQFDWKDYDFTNQVDIVALQEPFKIRTISVADGVATAAGSPVQKLWFETLKRIPVFELVGGKSVAESVARIVQQLDSIDISTPRGSQTGIVSGDYSAATDGLSIHATRIVFGQLTKGIVFPSGLKERLLKSLTGSLMDYSNTLRQFKDSIPPALYDTLVGLVPPVTRQRNGQLMGNILSFPILCIINFATYIDTMRTASSPIGSIVRQAIERGHFSSQEMSFLPLRINGDDILFWSDSELYATWRSRLGVFGFSASMGKNYFSNQFFTVNSQLFDSEGQILRPEWKSFETDFYRLRKVALSSGDDTLPADPRIVLPRIQQRLMSSVPVHSWPIMNKLWISHVSELLRDYYPGLNWFIPVEYGGFGLDSAGLSYEVTEAQLRLANKAVVDPDGFSRFLPRVERDLSSAPYRRAYVRSIPAFFARGEQVEHRGMRYIVNKDTPLKADLVVRDNGSLGLNLAYRAYPLVSDLEAQTPFISRWLDFQMDGQALSAQATSHSSSNLLRWGMNFSRKRVRPIEELDLRPRYRCSTIQRSVYCIAP